MNSAFLFFFQVYDYFDDEIDDQPDLTLNENEQSYRGTPATEYPPTNFSAILNSSNQHGKTVKKGYRKVYLKNFWFAIELKSSKSLLCLIMDS